MKKYNLDYNLLLIIKNMLLSTICKLFDVFSFNYELNACVCYYILVFVFPFTK